ncbi:hypothetical protein RGQ29_014004 [Quercus rubra]|uniref:F-box domain-containing protein n=1 Tax=Quercus rubra TaxID=3512 RepID=A0AAN7FL10_QUERU|nr:hypothetical protein RGQ29_014004 [Quercus rubra]
MFTTNEVLPEDLVIQILLWLPVVSLLRYKCVCKSWYALINGQNFINKHLLHNQTTLTRTRAQYFGIPNHVATNRVDSSNGLVCLHGNIYGIDIVLWNPATNETKVVPESRISPQGRVSTTDIGFGFDFKTNEYKVVKLLEIYDSNPELESWSKLFTIGPLMGIKKSLGFWKNESLFLINNDGQLLLYDSSTQEMTSLQVDGLPLQMITYVESLISFKGGDDLEEKGNS